MFPISEQGACPWNMVQGLIPLEMASWLGKLRHSVFFGICSILCFKMVVTLSQFNWFSLLFVASFFFNRHAKPHGLLSYLLLHRPTSPTRSTVTRDVFFCQMVRVTVEKMTGECIESLSFKCKGELGSLPRYQFLKRYNNSKCKENPCQKENYSSEQYFFRWELFMFQGGKTDHET